jgi:hypothetical protein
MLNGIRKITGKEIVLSNKRDSPATKEMRKQNVLEYAENNNKKMIIELQNMPKEIVDQAIENIKKSIKATNIENIYNEAIKIQRMNSLKNKFKSFNFTNISKKNTGDKLDRLQKINELRQQGAISEEEYLTLKNEILK